MTWNRKAAAAVGALALPLAMLVLPLPQAAAATFTERWCSSGAAAPCVISATRNGAALTISSSTTIEMIPTQSETDYNYTHFIVSGDVALTDTISVLIDLGGLKPEYTEGYAARPDVDRAYDGDGTYRVRYTGKPVLLTSGCTDTYPNNCTDTATDQAITFEAEVHQLKTNRDLVGFDRSQSADSVNGIFLESTPSGDYLESEWGNSRYLTNGTTRAVAQARFRIPYRSLVSDFRIPDPSTMSSSSLKGTVNGAPATYAFSQDPDGGAVYIDISGVTFAPGNLRTTLAPPAPKPRIIKIKRGTIVPTRPVITKAKRVTGAKANVTFVRAKARGSKLKGYQARCTSPGRTTRTATGTFPTVTVKKLTAGKKYTCSVRGLSKAGPGPWSVGKKV